MTCLANIALDSVKLEKKLPARLVIVNYTSIKNFKNTLESNDIGIVICTINAGGSSLHERNFVGF